MRIKYKKNLQSFYHLRKLALSKMNNARSLNSQQLSDMANKLRIHSIMMTNESKSGHPTSCASIAEIISVLFFNTMRYTVNNPRNPSADRFILSKGHAAPILYAAWAEAGLFPVSELMNLRKLPHDLEGHPTPRLSFIDVATGSLGQGLSVAAGMAYVGKNFDKADYRVYCLLGDGECAEGSVWEAMAFSSYYNLDNLCVIIDVNRLGQSQQTALGHDMAAYKKRVDAFGMYGVIVDGHNIDALISVFEQATKTRGKPTCVLAKTSKGKNFPDIENKEKWHGKPLGDSGINVVQHLKTLLSDQGTSEFCIRPLQSGAPCVNVVDIKLSKPPSYKPGDSIATRLAYGTALAKLVEKNPRVVALDGDMKNSTFSEKVIEVDPSKHIECFIAEQNLVGVATGISCRNRCVVFASTFAAFFCRAYDHIRMGAISQSNINLVGSHCGVSIGEDGPSQMALEDIAMFRAIPKCTVFYPADAVSCERAVEIAANTKGICYIRVSRPNTDIIYGNDEIFQIGKAKIVRKSSNDRVLVIGACITLQEVLKAAQKLEKDGISVRVMDLFTIKPIDQESIIKNARECEGRIITVEDHYPEGGIGEAVLSAVALEKGIIVKIMAVPKLPRSGPPNELLAYYGISQVYIEEEIRKIIKVC